MEPPKVDTAQMLAVMHDVVFTLFKDRKGTWRFGAVNDRFYLVTGYKVGEVVGHKVDEVTPKENWQFIEGQLRVALETHLPVSWEGTGFYPSGLRHSHITIVAPPTHDRPIIVGWAHDATECLRRTAAAMGWTEWIALRWGKRAG